MTQKIKVRPSHGCIEVKNVKNVEEAFALIEKILNTHPDIECDWVEGALIED
jgi:hypothetical protein